MLPLLQSILDHNSADRMMKVVAKLTLSPDSDILYQISKAIPIELGFVNKSLERTPEFPLVAYCTNDGNMIEISE